MRIGVFSDSHDHVDNVRLAVAEFNRQKCELVVFAGDFVSPIVVPPLRKLACPMLACFGDNDGNQVGLQGGMRIIGPVAFPPFCFCTPDGIRVLVAHLPEQARDISEGVQVVICGHTHKPAIRTDTRGVLFVNPGETSGWTYRKPTIAILETQPLSAKIVALPEMPAIPTE
jgi:putative phosphoesterase